MACADRDSRRQLTLRDLALSTERSHALAEGAGALDLGRRAASWHQRLLRPRRVLSLMHCARHGILWHKKARQRPGLAAAGTRPANRTKRVPPRRANVRGRGAEGV